MALPDTVPPAAVPIFDEAVGAIIGFQHAFVGWQYFYDLEGNQVDRMERGLESPVFSPIDLLLLSPALVLRPASRMVGAGVTAFGGVRLSTDPTALTIATRLRASLARLDHLAEIRFSQTALEYYGDPDRWVPLHVLRSAMKHGRRRADAGGKRRGAESGANDDLVMSEIRIKIYRRLKHPEGKEYDLEVLWNPRNNMIMHFKYKN